MATNWEEVKNHPLYMISKEYPHVIKKRTEMFPSKVTRNNSGYQTVSIDGQSYCLHRIIAEQWLPNPDNLKEVNHKNHIRDDNRLENLEWMSASDNRRDRKKAHKQKFEYVEEIPDTAVELVEYNGFEYNRYWFDYDTERLIINSRNRFHYVNISDHGSKLCTLVDVNGRQHTIGWSKLLYEMMRRIE